MLIPEKQPLKDSRELAGNASSSAVPQPQVIPAPSKSEIDILDTLQRRWLLSLAIFVCVVGAGFRLIRHYVHPTYQAQTTVYVSPNALKDYAEHVNELSYVTLINQQILTVLHYDTLNAALRRLDASGQPFQRPGETEQAAIERLKNSIAVWRVPDSYEISIAASGPDPRNLARIANAVADAYLEQGRGGFVSERAGRLAVLTKDKQSVEAQLTDKLATAAKYSEKLQVVDLDRAATFPDDAVLAQMRVALSSARQKRIEAEQELAVDEPSGAAAEAEQFVMNDNATRNTIDVLLQRRSDLHARLDGMLPANPLYKSAQKELSTVDNQLSSIPADMARTIGTTLMNKLHTEVDQSRRIEQALGNEVTQDAMNLEQTSRELHDARALNADIERLRAHLRSVQEGIDALNLQTEMPGFLSIFSVAQRPLQPLKNQKQKAVGALLGLALALALFFPVILDAVDPRIHSPASVEKIVGFLPIGMTIQGKAGREQFAHEHLHRVATGIQRCMARGAKTVLLTPLKFGLPDGLSDEIAKVLTERGFRPVLVHAKRQAILPADGQAQITALGRYNSILKRAEQDCDVVLVSAPPLLLSADAELLATEADVTLMIVQAGKSTRRDLERAARLLERLRVAGVGAILTSVRVERAGRLVKSDFRHYTRLMSLSAGSETQV
jgi:succinoglycan biosynthesis transport protein ExoP